MTTALVAAFAAVLLALWALIATMRTRARYQRVVEGVLAALDEYARTVSSTLERAVERARRARAEGVSGLDLLLGLDALAAHAVAEAAARTNAPVAALRVDGPEGEPVVASFGQHDAEALLERIPIPPDAQPFRALTVSWTHGHGPRDEEGREHRCALLVPIVEDAVRSGILVAYATEVDAFGPDRIEALERLVREVALALANARRLAHVERRVTSSDRLARRSLGA
jgi:GAF domain-containing protein